VRAAMRQYAHKLRNRSSTAHMPARQRKGIVTCCRGASLIQVRLRGNVVETIKLVGGAKSCIPGAEAYCDGMDSAILANEALKLPSMERARIIDALWSSLDPVEQDTIDRAWLLESQDRLAAFRAGQLTAISGEEALRAIEDELKK